VDVANISDLPDDLLAVIKKRLASKQPLVGDGGTMTIERSLPHGNVAAALGTLRNIGLDQVIGVRPSRERRLVMAMIVDPMISPGSKLSCSTGIHPDTAQNTLAEELQLGEVHELDDAIEWLLERQTRIENKLAKITHEENFPGERLIVCRNRIRFESSENVFHQLTESTPLQRRVLELLSTNA